MPTTTDVLDQARGLVQERLDQVNDEKGRLERALSELTGTPAKRSPGRPRKAAGAPKRRRRRGGTRADQAVQMVIGKPGISASDIAKAMKIKPNYLYRILGSLETEGRVKKDGRKYFPAS